MWSYYGAKTTLVKLYPPPKYGKIIEPFAGTARYSLLYWDREIVLVDKYPVIVDIWKWLQQCSPKDILSLPRPKRDDNLKDIVFDCKEQKDFMGFLISCGGQTPRNKPTKRKTIDRPNHVNFNLERIAKNLFKIKEWNISLGSYVDIPNEKATWFIDPPYQYGGDVYVMSNKKIDFKSLGEWSMNRGGQVIVCENTKANWMDFKPLATRRGSLATTTEVIFTNIESSYNTVQSKMF